MSEWAGLLTSRYTHAVWIRQFLTWRRMFWSSMASNVANPLLFLFAFGFGLGAVVQQIGGVDYLVFIVPGMMAHGTLFSTSFEATVSTFARLQMQKTWDATLATPVRLPELVMGELLWAASKGMYAALWVLLVAWLWGGVGSIWGALASLPILAVASLSFAATALASTSYAKDWEIFSYFFTFWLTPSFIFSGVFFEVSRFPQFVEALAWFLPMTHLVAIVRPLVVGLPLDWGMALLHFGYIVLFGVVCFWIAVRRFDQRMMQ